MDAEAKPRALLLDCLGTLVALQPPAPLLRDALRERVGVDVGAAGAAAAMRAEIGYYRAHLDTATDAVTLARLRERCAHVVRDALPALADVDLATVQDAMLDALRFTPYPEVAGVLRACRRAGLRLVVVSNWDVSLHEVLARTGLDALLHGAVASAEVGAAKPDPRPLRCGLQLAGVAADEAWLVGDTPDADVAGALAAGVRPVLVDRAGALGPQPPGVLVVAALDRLPLPFL